MFHSFSLSKIPIGLTHLTSLHFQSQYPRLVVEDFMPLPSKGNTGKDAWYEQNLSSLFLTNTHVWFDGGKAQAVKSVESLLTQDETMILFKAIIGFAIIITSLQL